MTWRLDLRPEMVRRFGASTLTTERRGTETAHLVTLPDGCQVRVLPDGEKSGQKRSLEVREALEQYDVLTGRSGDLTCHIDVLVPDLELRQLRFEIVDRDEGTAEALRAVLSAMAVGFDDTGRIHPPVILEVGRDYLTDPRAREAFAHLVRVRAGRWPVRFVAVGRSVYLWELGDLSGLTRLEVPA